MALKQGVCLAMCDEPKAAASNFAKVCGPLANISDHSLNPQDHVSTIINSSTQHEVWWGVGGFAYNTFHVQ